MRELLQRLRDPSVRALEVREGDVRVKVSKAVEAAPPQDLWLGGQPADAPAAAAAPGPAVRPAVPAKDAGKTVTAPLTGIFYRSPSPQAPPFVQIGSMVSPGDVIGLIEAMKLFNEVRSTMAGRVRKIAAESGQLVRAHSPIVELE